MRGFKNLTGTSRSWRPVESASRTVSEGTAATGPITHTFTGQFQNASALLAPTSGTIAFTEAGGGITKAAAWVSSRRGRRSGSGANTETIAETDANTEMAAEIAILSRFLSIPISRRSKSSRRASRRAAEPALSVTITLPVNVDSDRIRY